MDKSFPKKTKELSYQKEEKKEKDEEPPLKYMKKSNLQYLSAMRTITGELCDTDHDWERSVLVKMSGMMSTGPSSEVL